MENYYLKDAMLRVENELSKTKVAGFICADESPMFIKAIECAIAKGYLNESSSNVNGAIIIHSIEEIGKKYLKDIKA